jgi:hypothetical protein
MPTVISGDTGVSQVQAGSITESDIASGAVTDGKLSLTANSAQVKTAVNASGDAPIYACRAWVNFNGTGTVAIRASGNVSSITDGGVGIYTVNFNTAMPDANYAVLGTATTLTTGGASRTPTFDTLATGSVLVRTSDDPALFFVSILR